MRRYKLLVLFILFVLALPSFGQEEAVQETEGVMAWDQSRVELRMPSDETIAAYQQHPDYEYDRAQLPDPWWVRLLRWLRSHISIGEGGWSVLGWTLILVASVALIFLILKILGVPVKGLFIFSRSTSVTNLSFNAANIDIDDQNLDKKLRTFIDAEAYREATRILFILLLKQLNARKLIKWSAWKTDREYYYELQNEEMKASFLQLIRHYEYIWFGQFNLGKDQFNDVRLQFETFTNQLNQPNSKR